MSRVSCKAKVSLEASGLPELTALIGSQAATSILVSPAWDLALGVLSALRASCDPIAAARYKLQLSDTPPTKEISDAHAFAFISKKDISRMWPSPTGKVLCGVRSGSGAIGSLNLNMKLFPEQTRHRGFLCAGRREFVVRLRRCVAPHLLLNNSLRMFEWALCSGELWAYLRRFR